MGYTDDDGYWFAGGTRAFVRGGGWNYDALVGCFALSLGIAPSSAGTSLGFRCCK